MERDKLALDCIGRSLRLRGCCILLTVLFLFVSTISLAQETKETTHQTGTTSELSQGASTEPAAEEAKPSFLGSGVFWVGLSLPYLGGFYVSENKGADLGAAFWGETGLNLGHLRAFAPQDSSGSGWISFLTAGYWEYNGQTFSGNSVYTRSDVGAVRVYSAFYSFAWAWIINGKKIVRTHLPLEAAFFIGPSVERARFAVNAYLAEAPDRTELCERAVYDEQMADLRQHCQHVQIDVYATSYSWISGFIVRGGDNLFSTLTVQPYIATVKDGHRLARPIKLVISIGYKF